jgi:hypothetical protein
MTLTWHPAWSLTARVPVNPRTSTPCPTHPQVCSSLITLTLDQHHLDAHPTLQAAMWQEVSS